MYIYGQRTIKVTFSIFMVVMLIAAGIFSFSIPSFAATTPIKIMPVGDSCTAGMGGGNMGSYRTDLYKSLVDAGLSIDFVGSQKGGPNNLPDKDNEGHSGWTIPQISSNIDNWIRTYNPDVILLWIGGNDTILNGNVNTTGLSNLIDQILKDKPDITLFVSDYYPWPDQIKQYNAVVPGVVQQKVAAGKKNVHFVKLSDINFDRNSDISSDGLHLSTTGYTKVAKIWHNSTISILKSLSGGGGTPQEIIKGDVNGDGKVDAIDFGNLKKYLLGIDTSFQNANGIKAADMNDDGSIDSIDFAKLKTKLLG